jgi:hypothetical protein
MQTRGLGLTILAIRPRVESIPLAEPRTGAGNASGVYAYSRAAYKLGRSSVLRCCGWMESEWNHLWNQYLIEVLASSLKCVRVSGPVTLYTHSMALKPMFAAIELTVWNWPYQPVSSGQTRSRSGDVCTRIRDIPMRAAATAILHFRPTRGTSISCNRRSVRREEWHGDC